MSARRTGQHSAGKCRCEITSRGCEGAGASMVGQPWLYTTEQQCAEPPNGELKPEFDSRPLPGGSSAVAALSFVAQSSEERTSSPPPSPACAQGPASHMQHWSLSVPTHGCDASRITEPTNSQARAPTYDEAGG